MLKITSKKFGFGYAMAKNTIYSMKECNDFTVRGIKLVTDLLHLLHKKENLQNPVFVCGKQVIEKSLT